MKHLLIFAVFIFSTIAVTAQKPAATPVNEYAAIDVKALRMPDSLTHTTDGIAGYINTNFTTVKEKTRAIFIWLASNIQYDIENMFAINFYEEKETLIARSLTIRKGICADYATLFNDITLKCGISSVVVEGYTKQNGFTDYIPHAWCAAMVDSSWFIFDPTWGSGYVNGGKFYKKVNNAYYKVAPAVSIKSHMPFDYLWQFLYYPVSNQEFYEARAIENKTKPYFSFNDSIKVYQEQDTIARLTASAYRIEKNGVKNAMVFDRLRNIKMEIENSRQKKMVALFNAAVADYNASISEFNAFIQYRNKQFIPLKTDPEIQKMLDGVMILLEDAKNKISSIKNPDPSTITLISQFNKSMEEMAVHVKEQQDWLETYFGKSKSKRKAMFYEKKVTWFGIPVN
ncbi:MAG: hypothetical protein H7Y86_14765 [Rhizobacter sp.]|nr:hypothetical protein [Ferruginibacter sp.]